MADIFVSYKRVDRPTVERLVAVLEVQGWSVWWGTRLVGGQHWDATIEREINAARCVVVVWSPHSVDRDNAYWVHIEGHHGRERGILVPAMIDGARPPFAFSLIQARDLSVWAANGRGGEVDDLVADVGQKLAFDVSPAPPSAQPTPETTAAFPFPPTLTPQHARPSSSTPSPTASEAFAALGGRDDLAAWEAFLNEHGDTPFGMAARAKVRALRTAQEERKAAEAQARQEGDAAAIWATLKTHHSADELRDFIDHFDGTGAAAEAQAMLDEVEAVSEGRLRINAPAELIHGGRSGCLLPGEGKVEWFQDAPFGPQMVVAPAGEFWMGSPDKEDGHCDSESPRHRRVIVEPFAIGRFAVTFDEWDAARAAGTELPEESDQRWGRGNRPVINVSHKDAEDYCDWLSERTGRTYRLPSEVEWEYACRAGTDTPFWWGVVDLDGAGELQRQLHPR